MKTVVCVIITLHIILIGGLSLMPKEPPITNKKIQIRHLVALETPPKTPVKKEETPQDHLKPPQLISPTMSPSAPPQKTEDSPPKPKKKAKNKATKKPPIKKTKKKPKKEAPPVQFPIELKTNELKTNELDTKPETEKPKTDQKKKAAREALSQMQTTPQKKTDNTEIGMVLPLTLSSEARNYTDLLTDVLQYTLKLPQPGTLLINLNIDRAGKLLDFQIQNSTSQENKLYVTTKIQALAFPSFGTYFQNEKSHIFEVQLNGD